MSDNGKLLSSELCTIDGVQLSPPTANAYQRMKDAAKSAGIDIWIALPDGGYRSLFTQSRIANKSSVSTVSIAAAGSSSHGYGTRVDIGSFGGIWPGGTKRAQWLLEHASEFGFTREFQGRDPNHFQHDGRTAIAPLDAWYTSTELDGKPGVMFWKMMQLWAREDGYTGPIDGVLGVETWKALQRGRAQWDGYTGVIDGKPGEGTWKALQRAAAHYGYAGAVDGKPGANTYKGLARLLNGKF